MLRPFNRKTWQASFYWHPGLKADLITGLSRDLMVRISLRTLRLPFISHRPHTFNLQGIMEGLRWGRILLLTSERSTRPLPAGCLLSMNCFAVPWLGGLYLF